MRRQYKTADANRLIAEYNDMNTRLSEIWGSLIAEKNSLIYNLGKNDCSDYCEELILSYLNDQDDQSDWAKIFELFSIIYRLLEIADICDQIESIRQKFTNEIISDVEFLTSMNRMIQWFFSSDTQQQRANEIYAKLDSYMSDQLKGKVASAEKLLFDYEPVDNELLWQTFLNRKTEFKWCYQKYGKPLLGSGNPIEEIQKLTQCFDDALINPIELEKIDVNLKNNIRSSADGYVQSKLIKFLPYLPVDTIVKRAVIMGIYSLKEYMFNQQDKEIISRIRSSLKINLDREYSENSAKPLLASLKDYTLFKELKVQLIGSKPKDIDRIFASLNQLKKLNGGLSWLFKEEYEKEQIKSAYKFLCAQLDTEWYKTAESLNRLKDRSNNHKFVHIPNITEIYLLNKDHYQIILNELIPEKLGDDSYLFDKLDMIDRIISRINSIVPIWRKIDTAYLKADLIQQKLEKAVISAADSLRAKETMEKLADVPAYEIGQGKRNVKLNVLMNNGFDSVADLLNATSSELQIYPGIGFVTADVIKREADLAYKTEYEKTKIKLSVDDKSVQATGLVCAIYQYLDYQRSFTQQQKEYSVIHHKIVCQLKELSKIKKPLFWIMLPKQEKDRAFHALEKLELKDASMFQTMAAYVDILEKVGLDYSPNLQSDAWNSFANDPVSYINVIESLIPDVVGTNDKAFYGLPEELGQEVEKQTYSQSVLNCTLRRYQEMGVKYILRQKNVLLGDEMGLGKTVQAIAVMATLAEMGEKHFLVVCPASVLINWCREIERFSNLHIHKIHGYNALSCLSAWLKDGGVAVTTYEMLDIFKFDNQFRLNLLVVDEAHYIKNLNTKRAKNAQRLGNFANRKLFMTGTPLENKVSEMISLVSLLNKKIAKQLKDAATLTTGARFRRIIAPVYYRRKRDDVLTELPSKVESQEWCSLNSFEREVYEQSVLEKSFSNARRVSWNVEDISNSSKAARLLEIINDAENNGRKVLVFSFFLDTLSTVNRLLGERCIGTINGSVSAAQRIRIIDSFNNAPAGSVLTAQIETGGTGLNIQTASVIVICEPQLKPSIENQAISRSYRMGQIRNVLVYRLLCENTIDERIVELLKQKQAVFDVFADRSVSAEKSLEIDDKAAADILNEEIRRIKSAGDNTKTSDDDTHPETIHISFDGSADLKQPVAAANRNPKSVDQDSDTNNVRSSKRIHHSDENDDRDRMLIKKYQNSLPEYVGVSLNYDYQNTTSRMVGKMVRDGALKVNDDFKMPSHEFVSAFLVGQKIYKYEPFEVYGKVEIKTVKTDTGKENRYVVYGSHNKEDWYAVGELFDKRKAEKLMILNGLLKLELSQGPYKTVVDEEDAYGNWRLSSRIHRSTVFYVKIKTR